jgi:hypothetical protein
LNLVLNHSDLSSLQGNDNSVLVMSKIEVST